MQGKEDLTALSKEEIKDIFAAYNAGSSYDGEPGQRYGTQTLEYYNLFLEYEEE